MRNHIRNNTLVCVIVLLFIGSNIVPIIQGGTNNTRNITALDTNLTTINNIPSEISIAQAKELMKTKNTLLLDVYEDNSQPYGLSAAMPVSLSQLECGSCLETQLRTYDALIVSSTTVEIRTMTVEILRENKYQVYELIESPRIDTFQSTSDTGSDEIRLTNDRYSIIPLRNSDTIANVYEHDGYIKRLYGSLLSQGQNPRESADLFIQNNADILGVNPEDLRFESLQPIMYENGQYKFTGVYYTQYKNDIPVFDTRLILLVKNTEPFPLVLASINLRNIRGYTPQITPGMLNPQKSINNILTTSPQLTTFTQPTMQIWAGSEDSIAEPIIAYSFTADNGAPTDGSNPEKYVFVTDALTGSVLYKESGIYFVDVTGNVQGKATQGRAADFCENEVAAIFKWARVNIGSTTAYTDANGNFIISNSGASPVTVDSPIRGLWFTVTNQSGPNTILHLMVTPPGPANFMHNNNNVNEYYRAEVNGYVQANIVRDFTLTYNPSYPSLQQNEFPVKVNDYTGYCPGNAWYDGSSITFCRSGNGYPNTAWSTIIHHEYGHHLVAMAGSGQNEYGEGMGDVMGVLLTDDSGTGYGFTGNCNTPLRNANNNLQYPCSGEIHYCGMLLSGCVWSTRNQLRTTHPSTYLSILSNLAVNAMLLHNGGGIDPSITIDYLVLDDDNGNLNDGTPHYNEIAAGFGAHNMNAPSLGLLSFSFPNGLPDTILPAGGTTVRAVVSANNAVPQPGTGKLYVNNGTGWRQFSMNQVSSNVYDAVFPSALLFSKISYYFTAQTTSGQTQYWPMDAPGVVFHTAAADFGYAVWTDNFENDLGWTVQNSGLTDGAWERGIPAGGGTQGDPLTDADGSGKCYVTGNTPGHDVDGGYTWLISPKIDVSGGWANGYITYSIWYTNYKGGDPNNDLFKVYVSNNDGTSWTLVETIGPHSRSGWIEHCFYITDFVGLTNRMKVRFEASDLSSDSTVEAGVDAFRVVLFNRYQPPYIPHNPLPANRAVDVLLDAHLSWVGGDPNPLEQVTYDVYFGTTNPPPIMVHNQSSTSYDPGTMILWTTYYWKIVAFDNDPDPTGTVGPIWEFRSIDPIIPQWRNLGQSSMNIAPGESITLSAQGKDNIHLDWAWLATNESGVWETYSGGPWWDHNWEYSKQIRINHELIEEDLLNFPVVFTCTSPDFTAHAQGDGDDFVFVDETNTTILDHEIEYYNSATGELVAWVNVPSLSSTQDTLLNLYYGNPSCVSQQNPTAVWDNNYLMVHHMDGSTWSEIDDSTIYHSDVTSAGGTPGYNQNGKIGKAVYFNGLSSYLKTGGFRLPADQSYTASAWVYVDGGLSRKRTVFEGDSDNYALSLFVETDGAFWALTNTGGSGLAYCYSQTKVHATQPQWIYVSSRVNAEANFLELLINGSVEGNDTFLGSVYPETQGLNIGTDKDATSNYMYGKIDELRVSNIARDDSWIHTEYTMMSSPTTFMTIGPQRIGSTGTKYGSPMYLDGTTNQWVWSNFTWQNTSIPEGRTIGWRIIYVDASKNQNATDIMSFTVRSQPTTIQLTGDCSYADITPVNDASVQVVNIDTGHQWQATMDHNHYTLTLGQGVDVMVGQTLRIIARDTNESVNITEHIVTAGEFSAGQIHLDVTLNIHYRDLKSFPFSFSTVNSGAAVMKMMMDYLMWNKTQNPEGPQSQKTEQYYYDTYAGGNFLNGTEISGGLNTEIDDYNHGWIYGYFFNPSARDNVDDALKDAVIWLDYNVSAYNANRSVPVPKEGHPYHVPVAVPTGGNYNHWMTIRGIHTNRNAWNGQHIITQPITIYGFWLNDPTPGGVGNNLYVTAQQFKDLYFTRLNVPGDTYNNKYLVITDPARDVNVDTTKMSITTEPTDIVFSLKEAKQLQRAQTGFGLSSISANNKVVINAFDQANNVLMVDDVFGPDFTSSHVMKKPMYQSNGEYTVTFIGRLYRFEVGMSRFGGLLQIQISTR